MMRQLLKSMNYAAQLMALIDIGKTIKRWATKSIIKKQKERPKIKTQMTSPAKKQPTTQKKETQPTDFSAIALSCCDPYRIQNIEFYEI